MSAQTIITRTRTRARTPLALALLALLPASAWAQHAGHAPASSRDAPPAATAPPHHAPAPRSPQQRGATPTPPAGHDRHDGYEGHVAHQDHGPHVSHGPHRHDGHTGHAMHSGETGDAGTRHDRHASHDNAHASPAPSAGHDGHRGHDDHGAHGQHAQRHEADQQTAHTGHAARSDGAAHDRHGGHSDHASHAAHHARAPVPPQGGPTGHDHAGSHPQPHGDAPDTPRTPIPAPTEADFAAAFPVLAHHAMEHASPITRMVLFDRLEAWDADHGTGQAWEAAAWIGGDIHRLWLRSEGERNGGRTESSDLEVLYGRSVTAWWDLVGGIRQDFRPRGRTWGAFGVQGLAPHMFEVSATAYVGSGGQVQLKAEAEYDIRFTNRLILQPLVEATVSLEDEPREGIGSGLGKLETGLRLRYEFSRRFAPYVGLVHERNFGRTADYAEAAGGHARDTRVVAGVRVWF